MNKTAKPNVSRWRKIQKQLRNDWMLYALLLPVLIWYIVFCYLPMGGVTLAFREYRYDMGLWHSPWVAFEHFETMFKDAEFWRAFANTLIFSLGKLVFHFPVPIIVAILLNEIRHPRVKKFFQTVFTFPHFISWVVLSGILINMFASNGIINQVLGQLGFDPVAPLMSLTAFRPFIWITNIWKEFGWDAIIYMAALTNIDPQLYEAASIDGANRLQKMLHVTWPGIRSTVCIMLILQIGGIYERCVVRPDIQSVLLPGISCGGYHRHLCVPAIVHGRHQFRLYHRHRLAEICHWRRYDLGGKQSHHKTR